MTAATRYAQALFNLTQEGKQQAAVTPAVAALSSALQDAAIAQGVTNPRLTIAQRTALVGSMSKAIKAPSLLANTLGLLAQNNRLSLLAGVLTTYQQLADAANSITHVKVSSATALTDAQRTKLTALIKAQAKATEVRLEETLDASLKGGFRAFFNGLVWDASLSGNLARLSTRLKTAIAQRQD
jgi:F-type H+-transporting ATPase subunit delta